MRKTTGFFGATLRIPLGDFTGGGGSQALDELDRRMIGPGASRQYADDELAVLQARARGDLRPPHDLAADQHAALCGQHAGCGFLRQSDDARRCDVAQDDQRLHRDHLQAGHRRRRRRHAGRPDDRGRRRNLHGRGYGLARKFSHDFAPGTTNPTVSPAHKYDDVITLASTTNLYGFKIAGQFGDAVYGHNVDDVHIEKLTIDGTGGDEDGIYIYRDKSGTELIDIGYTAVSHVLGDGIRIESEIGDGGTTVENITLHNLSVSDVTYGNGVVVGDYAYKGSKIADTISLSNISVHNVGDTGIARFRRRLRHGARRSTRRRPFPARP